MKRSYLLLPALMLAVFGGLLALNIVNFEAELSGETSRIDRWVMIFSFAGAAALVGLASADGSSDASGAKDSGRAAAARKLDEGRPDASELPSKPGSLLKKSAAAATADEHAFAEQEIDEVAIDELVPEPIADGTDIVAVPSPEIDLVDAELQSLIDEDQMQEINDLVAAADAAELSSDEPHEAIVAGTDSVEPLARLELRLADYDDDDLKRVVKESEAVVIAEMVRSGQLTSEGELTEKDIASMIFLAYTSEEMLAELQLRRADQLPGLDASTGSDLAPLKNIE